MKSVVVLGVALATFAGCLRAQEDEGRRAIRPRTVYEDMQLFSQVLNQLRVNHPDSLDTHTLMMAAIEGMVRAADPHSYVLPAMRLSPEKHEAYAEGKLHPVPLSFTYVDGTPLVLSISPGSRAAMLGIFPGDEVLAIDDRAVTAESETELEILLAGEEGTTVAITFRRRRRDGEETVFVREVERERAGSAPALVASLMLDSINGYIRLAHFLDDKIADQFHSARERLERVGMTRLVLDLRDNGGGIVNQAARITGEFLPKRTLVYTAAGSKRDVFDTVTIERSYVNEDDMVPVVVMVNEGTASAAELLTGALQDHDRALVVGRPTFGKSLLMQGLPMTDGSFIVLTIGHVKTPCGRVLQRRYRGVR